jgi:AcrR family transcriptional regulator
MTQRENSKELILNEAVQIASVHGLNGLTIGYLAKELNMSKGGICAHYPSKQHLQLAVVDKAVNIFTKAVITPTLNFEPGLPRLTGFIDAWFEYLKAGTFEGGCFFTNAVLELDDLEDNLVKTAVTAEYNRLIAYIESCAGQAVAKKEFSADLDITQFSFEFIGCLFSALLWRGLGRKAELYSKGRLALTRLVERSKVS